MFVRTTKRLALSFGLVLLAAGTVSAQHIFDGNILFNNTGGDCVPGGALGFDACGLISHFPSNDAVDPQLASPRNTLSPNWQPAATSPASGANDNIVAIPTVVDGCNTCPDCPSDFFTPVCYRGAVPPALYGDDWTLGWTDYTFDGAGRVYPVRPVVTLTGPQAADVHMTAANHYLLDGLVTFQSGTTLTIDAGVYVFGKSSTTGTLVIDRGARILANGTKTAPIVMTTDLAPGFMIPGGWGGLVLNGNGIANCADCVNGASCISEGTNVQYCGNDDCSDKGVLRYVRIEFAGDIAGVDNELNSFTFNAVGCKTVCEYLQAHRGLDDQFEWFGGTARAKWLVGTGGGDDGLDWQMGWRGAVQFAVIQAYGPGEDKGIEADNNEFAFDAPCRSNPVLSNLTLIGSGDPTSSETHGVHFRRGTDENVVNSIIYGWKDRGVRVQHDATAARGFGATPAIVCSPANVGDGLADAELVVRTFPNPAVHEARLFFSLPSAAHAELNVYDSNGRLVEALVNAEMNAGTHTAVWNVPAGQPSGAYFYRLNVGRQMASGRIVTAR